MSLQDKETTHRNDSGSCAHGAYIEHENFSFAEFLHLALLLASLHCIHCTLFS